MASMSRRLIVSLFRRCAVSRSEAISRQRSMGTRTAVGLPFSSVTYWRSLAAIDSGVSSAFHADDTEHRPQLRTEGDGGETPALPPPAHDDLLLGVKRDSVFAVRVE